MLPAARWVEAGPGGGDQKRCEFVFPHMMAACAGAV